MAPRDPQDFRGSVASIRSANSGGRKAPEMFGQAQWPGIRYRCPGARFRPRNRGRAPGKFPDPITGAKIQAPGARQAPVSRPQGRGAHQAPAVPGAGRVPDGDFRSWRLADGN